jgi:hypothetical protein
MSSIYSYHGFGLDFRSDIPLPEMRVGSVGQGKPVVIRIASAPCPEDLTPIAPGVAAGPQHFWMDVPGIARLHVALGSLISIDPAPDATMNDIRAYLLGSAMGALLHQRGLLPLHASAVEIGGVAAAFCGASGAGKSSLALHLVKRGHRLLCDDICAIDTTSREPRLWPGLVNLKLWRESLASAGEAHQTLQAVLPGQDKYKLPIAEAASYHSYSLGHVFLLRVSKAPETTITTLRHNEGLSALVTNTFRGQLVDPMRQNRSHFDQCILTASKAKVRAITRPWSLSHVDATCDAIDAEIKTL